LGLHSIKQTYLRIFAIGGFGASLLINLAPMTSLAQTLPSSKETLTHECLGESATGIIPEASPDQLSIVACSARLAKNWLESAPTTTNSDCTSATQQLIRDDAEWFIKNLGQFEAINQRFQATQAEFEKKITELQNSNLVAEAEPFSGQKSAPLIGITQAQNFLDQLNKKNLYVHGKELPQVLNDPIYLKTWKLEHSLHQIKTALSILTRQINQSLKSGVASYQLILNTDQTPFDLEMRIRIHFDGKKVPFTVSLRDFPKSEFKISEAEKWKSILTSDVQINGLPVESGARLRARRNKRADELARQNCRISIPLNVDRVPFRAITQNATTLRTYQQLSWDELGALPVPVSSLSLNDRGQVIATGITHEVISYQTQLESEIWTLASVGMPRPLSFNTQKLLAVSTHGALYEAPLQTDRPTVHAWKLILNPYARQLQVLSQNDVWALDLSGRIIRNQSGSSWDIQSQVAVSAFSAWEPSVIFMVPKNQPHSVGLLHRSGQGSRWIPLQHFNENITKVIATSATSAIALSESGQLNFVSVSSDSPSGSDWNQHYKISEARFIDIAANADGIICGISAADKKVRCLK
jgi:hypothetical protein